MLPRTLWSKFSHCVSFWLNCAVEGSSAGSGAVTLHFQLCWLTLLIGFVLHLNPNNSATQLGRLSQAVFHHNHCVQYIPPSGFAVDYCCC